MQGGRSLISTFTTSKPRQKYRLGTDYCVKAIVLDACGLGFPMTVLENAYRAVSLSPDDGVKALGAIRRGQEPRCFKSADLEAELCAAGVDNPGKNHDATTS
jgi:hypothetical protein